MTKNAMEFVTPLTFQTISGHPVTHEMFELFTGAKIGHIALADIADQIVIAPATANIIGKIANGIADDFLSTMIMATAVPVLFVPSMNTKMWESKIVQANIEKLKENGYEFMEPASGDLACGWQGKGRLPTLEDIVEKMEDIFTEKDLVDETDPCHGRTDNRVHRPGEMHHQPLFGKDGLCHREDRAQKGRRSDPRHRQYRLDPPETDIEVINVVTAEEMRTAVMEEQRRCSVIIKAAAVADYRCKERELREDQEERRAGGDDPVSGQEPRYPAELGKIMGDRVLVGFAAETDNVIENALHKLKKKKLDLIVANDVTKAGIGFGSDNNEVTIIDPTGGVKHVPKLSKEEIAHIILDSVLKVIKKKKKIEDDWY